MVKVSENSLLRSGPLAARTLSMTVRDHAGKLLWEQALNAADLK